MTDRKFHKIIGDISGISVPEMFTFPFCYTPHPLVEMAAGCLRSYLDKRADLADELLSGKMMGVLVVENPAGEVGYLAAFSGNLSHSNTHDFFVPAVYDILRPDGEFKRREAEITEINRRVDQAEHCEAMAEARSAVDEVRMRGEKAVADYRAYMAQCKAERQRLRANGGDTAALVAESQYQKAELKRLRRRVDGEVRLAGSRLSALEAEVATLKEERRRLSESLQRWIFDRFVMLDAKGDRRTLTQIFADARGELPPAGAGECAAPKLLQYAYVNGYRPLAMGEFWVGKSPVGELRRDGCFYGACKGKCEPILNYMLQGLRVEPNPLPSKGNLRIVYSDDDLLVVDKPSGLLSVPGPAGGMSVQQIIRQQMPDAECAECAHRLDQHTSGLLLVAKTGSALWQLRSQFENREVKKKYIALLDGEVVGDEGEIRLPIAPDWPNRPRQKVDFNDGKAAVTAYRVLSRLGRQTRVEFRPQTGRTHQLRVHAAYARGLDAPIHGDMLYGTPSTRLCLHASYISFRHPSTGEMLEFSSEPEF